MHVLLIALILVPLTEIGLFVVLGGAIGLWATLGVVLATAVAGGLLLRRQGLRTLENAQRTMRDGAVPVSELAEALMLFLAGAFLLTPGFLTDAIGFLLLVPTLRRLAAHVVLGWLARRGELHVMGARGSARTGPARGPAVIDAEFEPVDDPPADDEPRGRTR